MTNNQRDIEELLARRIGLDPVTVGPQMVVRAARRRMAELGLDDLGVYASRLGESEAELQALIEEVVIPESWFFRDERPFHWLADHVRARWVGDPSRVPLRALSLACAGGEEPYSIAITLRDAGLPARRFRIDAVDVSARRLAFARHGIYSANAFRGCELGGRAQYFREHAPAGYEVVPAIRSTVHFLQASVIDPKLLDGSPPYDVVFCRNLLIYLDAMARTCVLAALDRLLAADGVLFIGHADRLERVGEPSRFTAIGEAGCFAYRKTSWSGVGSADRVGGGQWAVGSGSGVGGGEWGVGRGERQDDRLGLSSVPYPTLAPPQEPKAEKVERRTEVAIPHSPLPTPHSSLLEQAAELANQGRHAEAIAACEQQIRLKGPGAPAYYLMGMICQAAGDRRRAEECFHKTAYLDPKHDEALLSLSLLAESRGDRGAADGFRRRARRTSAPSRPEGKGSE